MKSWQIEEKDISLVTIKNNNMTLKQLKKAVNNFDSKLDNKEIVMTSWMSFGFGEEILCTKPTLTIKKSSSNKVCLIMEGEEDDD